MAEPKCPECNVEGTKHIVSANSVEKAEGGYPWFNIAYCSECGHIYGVFAKITHSPPAPSLTVPGL